MRMLFPFLDVDFCMFVSVCELFSIFLHFLSLTPIIAFSIELFPIRVCVFCCAASLN